MLAITSLFIASYNILNPFHAVKWGEETGLNEYGIHLPIDDLKAATENNEGAWKKYSNWGKRKYHIANNFENADIVCLQEVSNETINDLLEISPNHELASVGYHYYENIYEVFGNAILYNPDKVELIDAYEIDHTYDDTSRKAACANFLVAGKMIKVASVHLEGYPRDEEDFSIMQEYKKKGFYELCTYKSELEKELDEFDGIVIAGDLNENPLDSDSCYDRTGYLISDGYAFDQNLSTTRPVDDYRLDWIFYKSLVNEYNTELISIEIDQEKASDHLMIGTLIRWMFAKAKSLIGI